MKRTVNSLRWRSVGRGRTHISPEPVYSPFTAADAKLPLSIEPVNNKPQYLVYALQRWEPSCAIPVFGLWKAQIAASRAALQLKFATFADLSDGSGRL